jgi:hypothetical protein
MRDDNQSKRTAAADRGSAGGRGQPSPNAQPARTPGVAKPKLPDPTGVLDDPTLTREQKIEKLRRWSLDARRVEASNDDGLQGAVTPSNLPAIQDALRQLGAGEDPAVAGPGLNP